MNRPKPAQAERASSRRTSMASSRSQPLDRVSPLAVPVMLEIGRESVYGEASDALLAAAQAELVKEATG
jgi:hypothetical protein